MSIKRIVILLVVVLVTLTACTSPRVSIPTKLIPAYSINISFPSQLSEVTVEQGGSVTLPVTVKSLVDQPINIRLVLEASVGQLPQFLQYDVPKYFVTLAPNASLETQITITVSDDAQVGDYKIGVNGQLQEPVNDRSKMTMFFDLVVTAK
ncbi:MAG: hypothetical protein PHR56_05735 [Dehalococcoidales bacterium]|nr:hypothetical protein [Dehalococcoidales bacterium]